MTRVLTDVDVKIVPRSFANGHPFTELLHTWVEEGRRRCALSRVPWTINDTPHDRAFQIAAFKTRQAHT